MFETISLESKLKDATIVQYEAKSRLYRNDSVKAKMAVTMIRDDDKTFKIEINVLGKTFSEPYFSNFMDSCFRGIENFTILEFYQMQKRLVRMSTIIDQVKKYVKQADISLSKLNGDSYEVIEYSNFKTKKNQI